MLIAVQLINVLLIIFPSMVTKDYYNRVDCKTAINEIFNGNDLRISSHWSIRHITSPDAKFCRQVITLFFIFCLRCCGHDSSAGAKHDLHFFTLLTFSNEFHHN